MATTPSVSWIGKRHSSSTGPKNAHSGAFRSKWELPALKEASETAETDGFIWRQAGCCVPWLWPRALLHALPKEADLHSGPPEPGHLSGLKPDAEIRCANHTMLRGRESEQRSDWRKKGRGLALSTCRYVSEWPRLSTLLIWWEIAVTLLCCGKKLAWFSRPLNSRLGRIDKGRLSAPTRGALNSWEGSGGGPGS